MRQPPQALEDSMTKKLLFILMFGVVGIPFMLLGFVVGCIYIAAETGWLHAADLIDQTLERK
jgi:hypothetical protein